MVTKMNDYIITVDRDGQPYIEHAWGNRWANKSHKYIMKIGEGAKARYLYTQEEVRAYMQGGRQALQNKSQNAKAAVKKTGNQLRTGANKLSSKLETTTNNAVGQVKGAAKNAKKTAENLVDKKITGYNSRDNRNTELKIASSNERYAKNTISSSGRKIYEEAAKKARDRADEYNQEYKKSLFGKAENAGNKLKSTSDRMKDEFRKSIDTKKKLEEAKDTLRKAYDNGNPNLSRDVHERARQIGEIKNKVDERREEYYKTPLGKVEKIKDDIENKAEKTGREFREKKREFADNVQNKVTDRVNQAKDTYKKLSDKAKDLAGADERKKFDSAWEKVMKAEPGSKAQEKALDEFMEARKAYFKTPMGKADYGTERINEILSGADGTPKEIAKDLVDKAKASVSDKVESTSDRMKNEFRKKKEEAKDKASDAVNKTINKVSDAVDSAKDSAENIKARQNVKKLEKEIKEERSKLNNIGNLEGQRKIRDLEIKKLEEQTKYDKSPETIAVLEEMKEARKKQDERIKKIEEAKSQSDSSKQKSKFSEYTKGDKDFDDKNFDEKNRVGDSDFFMAKRSDGSTVILEEDMKWVLPKGVNPNDPAIKRALTKEYKAGSNEEWVKQVTEAIDDAVEEVNKKK